MPSGRFGSPRRGAPHPLLTALGPAQSRQATNSHGKMFLKSESWGWDFRLWSILEVLGLIM